MAIDATSLNLFAQSSALGSIGAAKGTSVNQTKFGGSGLSSGRNLFSGNTSGINESMNDKAVFTTAQAGVKNGVAGGQLNLIA